MSTTDREEAARAAIHRISAIYAPSAGIRADIDLVQATILADIEEGKRKDATIERLTKAAKAVVARYHMEIMSDGDTHEFLAALKEATK